MTLRRFLLVTRICMVQLVGVGLGWQSTSPPLVQCNPSVKHFFSLLNWQIYWLIYWAYFFYFFFLNSFFHDISLFRELSRPWTALPVSTATFPKWLALRWPPASRPRCSGDVLPRCFCPPFLPLHSEMFPHHQQRCMRHTTKNMNTNTVALKTLLANV